MPTIFANIARPIVAPFACLALFMTSIAGCGGAKELQSDEAPLGVVSEALVTTQTAVADTFVRDGSFANDINGTKPTLEVKKNASAGLTREAYLRFSLSSFAGTVQNAKLRLFGKTSSAGNLLVVARLLRDNAFDEASTSWNTKPETMPIELGRINMTSTTGSWFEFDVTGVVRSQKRRNFSTIDFALVSTGGSGPNAIFSSAQATIAAERPQLVIDTATALFVVANTTLAGADAAINNRLTQMGFAVTPKKGLDSSATDANGKSIVVISSTVPSADVAAKFRDVAVPVVTWENAIYDDMKMTGVTSGTDFGTTTAATTIAMSDNQHALAGGAEGTVTVAGSNAITWGKPATTGLKIATVSGDTTKATVFGYEKGAAMVGMNAPARRVGLFLSDATASSLSPSGWALFEAAVNWASSSRPFRTKKVGIFYMDPILESEPLSPRVHAYQGYPDPHVRARELLREFELTSGDYTRYQIAAEVDVDAWPPMLDTTPYTDATWIKDWGWGVACFRSHPGAGNSDCANKTTSGLCVFRNDTDEQGYCEHQYTKLGKSVDYKKLIADRGWDQGINAGTYDEVWVAATTALGFSESRMVGPNAIDMNSGPIKPPDTTATRRYVIEYLDWTVANSEFQHAYFHRVEWLMRFVYYKRWGRDALMFPTPSNWNTSPYDTKVWGASGSATAVRKHFLDKFTVVDGVAQNLKAHGDTTAVAAVGVAHFVPGAKTITGDNYNYAAPAVLSSADDFMYNFPNLTGENRSIGPSEWVANTCWGEYACGFQLWLLNHTPRVAGRSNTTDKNVLLNWWEYTMNFDAYSETFPP